MKILYKLIEKQRIRILLIITLGIIGVSPLYSQTCQDSAFQSQLKKWEFNGVLKIDSIGKNEIFEKARQWFSETFVSAKNVLDNSDKDAGVLFGHGELQLYPEDLGLVSFNIELRVRDGKLRYQLSNFSHHDFYATTVFGTKPVNVQFVDCGMLNQEELPSSYKWKGVGKGKWQSIRGDAADKICTLVNQIKSGLSKEVFKIKDDW